MPGTTLFLPFKRPLEEFKQEIHKSLKSVLYNKNYSLSACSFEQDFFIGVTKYPGYPMKTYEDQRFKIYLEGIFYNLEEKETASFLINFASSFILKKSTPFEAKQYLSKIDGDFLITILDKKERNIIIFNDFFGRLPTYKYMNSKYLIISREIRLILNFIDNFKLDEMGLALGLLLGYPLGERTYFSGITKLKPGSIIEMNISDAEVKENQTNYFNFENKDFGNRSISENVEELKRLFLESCNNRMRFTSNPILSLRGGLDSRTVAAGMCESNQMFKAVTYLDFEKRSKNDVEIAEEIASTLKIPWEEIELSKLGKDNKEALISMKCGMNHVGMGFLIEFFEKLKSKYGQDIFYFTGDGGDKILPDLRPLRKLKNYNDLINLIVDSQASCSLEFIEKVLGISKKALLEEMTEILSLYHEETWNMKFIKFLLQERTINWLFEGEDRNRFFFWSVTPFYSLDFFRHAMNIPDKYKSNYFLYEKFLSSISKDLTNIPNENFNDSISSYKYKLYKVVQKIYWNYNLQFLKVRKTLPKTRLEEIIDQQSLKDFYNQLEKYPFIFKYFDKKELEKNLDQLNKFAFNNLFTYTTLIEQFTKKY